MLILLLPLLAACGGEDTEPTAPPPTAAVSQPTAASPAASAATPIGSPGPTPITPVTLTPGPDVTAEQILRFGAGRMANIHSGHFKATIEGTVYIDDDRTLQLVSAEGNVVQPDRVQTQFRIRVGNQAISTIRLITIGDEAWMTDLITGKWVPAATEFNYDASILFDPSEGLAAVMLGVENPVRLADEKVDGREAYVVEATGGKELIGPITSNTLLGYPVTVRAWIDQETGDLLRIVLIEPPSPENSDPSTWTLELSKLDSDFTIEPPKVED
jgi:hypothetical protein